jgi:3-oxoacyl-[acyl-carrier protein] reductase
LDGYAVSTFSRSPTAQIERFGDIGGQRFFHRQIDIASRELGDFVNQAVNQNGAIYGVINNAAVVQEGILATLPEVEIDSMIDVNLRGTIRLTRLALRSMIRGQGGGRILSISSIIGTRGYNGLAVYSATKAGVDGFTRSLAREVGRKGITVNAIGPGYFETELSSSLTDIQKTQIVRRTPLGRLATAQDIVPLVCFLLSDAADFITGQTILVDGGISS